MWAVSVFYLSPFLQLFFPGINNCLYVYLVNVYFSQSLSCTTKTLGL